MAVWCLYVRKKCMVHWDEPQPWCEIIFVGCSCLVRQTKGVLTERQSVDAMFGGLPWKQPFKRGRIHWSKHTVDHSAPMLLLPDFDLSISRSATWLQDISQHPQACLHQNLKSPQFFDRQPTERKCISWASHYYQQSIHWSLDTCLKDLDQWAFSFCIARVKISYCIRYHRDWRWGNIPAQAWFCIFLNKTRGRMRVNLLMCSELLSIWLNIQL